MGTQRIDERYKSLSQTRLSLIDYLQMKLKDQDWHGVQDAASDLRDIDAELQGLQLAIDAWPVETDTLNPSLAGRC
jgi:hypothetical protein